VIADYLECGWTGIAGAAEVGGFVCFCVFVWHFRRGGEVVREVEDSCSSSSEGAGSSLVYSLS
jgi:hypothetical protein